MRRPRKKREFDQNLIHVARVARVVKGGKRFRFRTTVAIGNRRGKVAVAMAKGMDVTGAIDKAVAKAKKRMVEVPIINETIPHEIKAKFGAAKILLKPAPPGTGVIAGGPVRAVLDLAGIKNILSKSLGSKSKANNAQVTWLALTRLERPEEVSRRRNKEVVGVVKETKPHENTKTQKHPNKEQAKSQPQKNKPSKESKPK